MMTSWSETILCFIASHFQIYEHWLSVPGVFPYTCLSNSVTPRQRRVISILFKIIETSEFQDFLIWSVIEGAAEISPRYISQKYLPHKVIHQQDDDTIVTNVLALCESYFFYTVYEAKSRPKLVNLTSVLDINFDSFLLLISLMGTFKLKFKIIYTYFDTLIFFLIQEILQSENIFSLLN